MAEPKKRLTSARSGARRSHLAKKAKKLTNCPKCEAVVPSHLVCGNCGFYKGQDVMQLEQKEKEKAERRKAEEKDHE